MNRPSPHAIVLLLLSLPLFVACGGSGGGATPGQQAAPLTITTESLPDGTMGAPYNATQLQTFGEQGPVTWTVSVGNEPPGLTLSAGGLLAGTPSTNGAFPFTVEATDGASTATRAYTVTIADLVMSVVSGLTAGDAWANRDVSLATSGASGTVTFSAVFNQSGGTFTSINAVAGTAVWTPGPNAGTDTLRATDDPTGGTSDVVLVVQPNATANYAPGFGTNDVWWVSMDVKRGTHAYQSDWYKALVDIGMWPSGTTGPATTDLEQLVVLCMRVQLLRELNLIYRRNADGSEGPTGLKISFPYDQPQAPTFTAPSVAQSAFGAADKYSIMEIADAGSQSSSVLGVAFLDTGNPFHDHDGGANLGVLIDHVTTFFSNVQSSRLITGNPINDNDIPILKALIYQTPMSGARFNTIRNLVEYYSRAVALVAAHEIGHSVGLDHNGTSSTLMASSISFGNGSLSSSNAIPLTASEVSTLSSGDLPGAGRTSLPLTLFGGTGSPANNEACVCHADHGGK